MAMSQARGTMQDNNDMLAKQVERLELTKAKSNQMDAGSQSMHTSASLLREASTPKNNNWKYYKVQMLAANERAQKLLDKLQQKHKQLLARKTNPSGQEYVNQEVNQVVEAFETWEHAIEAAHQFNESPPKNVINYNKHKKLIDKNSADYNIKFKQFYKAAESLKPASASFPSYEELEQAETQQLQSQKSEAKSEANDEELVSPRSSSSSSASESPSLSKSKWSLFSCCICEETEEETIDMSYRKLPD